MRVVIIDTSVIDTDVHYVRRMKGLLEETGDSVELVQSSQDVGSFNASQGTEFYVSDGLANHLRAADLVTVHAGPLKAGKGKHDVKALMSRARGLVSDRCVLIAVSDEPGYRTVAVPPAAAGLSHDALAERVESAHRQASSSPTAGPRLTTAAVLVERIRSEGSTRSSRAASEGKREELRKKVEGWLHEIKCYGLMSAIERYADAGDDEQAAKMAKCVQGLLAEIGDDVARLARAPSELAALMAECGLSAGTEFPAEWDYIVQSCRWIEEFPREVLRAADADEGVDKRLLERAVRTPRIVRDAIRSLVTKVQECPKEPG